MSRRCSLILLLVLSFTIAAFAGTIEGKVAPGNSVVYVDTIPGKTFPAPTAKPVIDQKSMVYSPHVTVVQQGTTVEFLNSDTVQHNVFWTQMIDNKKATHNHGTWPKGQTKPYTFDTPGVVSLLCNIHLEMAGFIVVSPTPYFAQTDAAGNFKINDVPDGKYNLVAWHEGSKTQTKPVVVAGTGKVDFTLSQ
jgi:plastocyanin